MARKIPASKKSNVEVKRSTDVVKTINAFIFKNLHDRYNAKLSTKTREAIVAYGPWLGALLLLIIAPELLALAKTGSFISFSGFVEKVLFSKESWVLLVVVFINCLATVDSLSYMFQKAKRGWNAIYGALLINIVYVLYQLLTNMNQPAPAILSLVGFGFCLFSLLDIRTYYT